MRRLVLPVRWTYRCFAVSLRGHKSHNPNVTKRGNVLTRRQVLLASNGRREHTLKKIEAFMLERHCERTPNSINPLVCHWFQRCVRSVSNTRYWRFVHIASTTDMPRKRLIDDLSKVAGGSDSEDSSGTGTELPSSSHRAFFTEDSVENRSARGLDHCTKSELNYIVVLRWRWMSWPSEEAPRDHGYGQRVEQKRHYRGFQQVRLQGKSWTRAALAQIPTRKILRLGAPFPDRNMSTSCSVGGMAVHKTENKQILGMFSVAVRM